MEFKVFLLCFAVLVAATSAASVCTCEDKKEPTRSSVSNYTLKMNKNGKDYEEKVDVDTEKETETFHVPKTSPDNEAGDVVYDFKKNLTMIHLPATNSCFLSDSTDDVPKPAALKKLLESKGNQVVISREQTELKLKVVGTLQDRSELSDEMVDLCKNLPIYVMVEGEPEVDATTAVQPTKTVPAKRSKRDSSRLLRYKCKTVCRLAYRRICIGWGICRRLYYRRCYRVCNWVLGR